METIEFIIPGSPMAQNRHRDGARVKTAEGKEFRMKFDPSSVSKTDFLAKCLNMRPASLLDGPLCLECEFTFVRPLGHYTGGKREKGLKKSAPFWMDKKPDLDNLLKFVKDALKGVYYYDDKQIVAYNQPVKIYGDIPQIRVKISQIQEKRVDNFSGNYQLFPTE